MKAERSDTRITRAWKFEHAGKTQCQLGLRLTKGSNNLSWSNAIFLILIGLKSSELVK
jgi:hypothetical protein